MSLLITHSPIISISLVTDPWRRAVRSRVYVWGTKVTDMKQPAYSTKGDDIVNDALWRKFNKAEIKAQREEFEKYKEELEKAVVIPDNFKMGFSRKAGCTCECSPGFIVYGTLKTIEGKFVDSVHITVP